MAPQLNINDSPPAYQLHQSVPGDGYITTTSSRPSETVIAVPSNFRIGDIIRFNRILKNLPEPCPHTSWTKQWPFLRSKVPWHWTYHFNTGERLLAFLRTSDISKYGHVSDNVLKKEHRFYGKSCYSKPIELWLMSQEVSCLLLHKQPCQQKCITGLGWVTRHKCGTCDIECSFYPTATTVDGGYSIVFQAGKQLKVWACRVLYVISIIIC